jgi:glycosyltransferase involved in cell wall biosynthesis
MSELPLVSIVTPSYNQGTYLEAAVQSVLAQDYPRVEYLIVDGDSTDSSLEIIRRYADRLTWWVSEPDSGQAEAINKGLARARGEIVAWLNSDDLYLPGAVSDAVSLFEAKPEVGMVFGDAVTIDSHGIPLNSLIFGDWGIKELAQFRIICQPAVLLRRVAVEQAGYLDPDFDYMLDHQLWLRVASSWGIDHAASTWAAARHHPTAKNVAQAAAFSQEIYRIVEWMESDPVLKEILERDRRRIMGGAHRLSARYLLDGGLPASALRAYWRALLAWPSFTLQHWHRMVYALLSLMGGAWMQTWYQRLSSPKTSVIGDDPRLEDWPGLRIN